MSNSQSNFKIINIGESRWQEFKSLRLESLKEELFSFGISYDEEVGKLQGYWKDQLKHTDKHLWYFVEVDRKLAGLAVTKFGKRKSFSHIARISGIYLQKGYRGQGIAEKLVRMQISDAFSKVGIRKIKLVVNVELINAIKLYEKCGFVIVAKLKSEMLVGNVYCDAYLMEVYKND